MKASSTDSIERYKSNLKLTADWLIRSIEKGKGGSCAHFSPLIGWSKPYPETTGYIIPTLLRISDFTNDSKYSTAALNLGEWLLNIQSKNGSWYGGLHPNKTLNESVFNTGQILKGMVSLYEFTKDETFLNSADKGANWLSSGIDSNGSWPAGDYKATKTPSYYTHVAWPILEVWKKTNNESQKNAAKIFLDMVLDRILPNGAIKGWGFYDEGFAFTHTIAYTIRGFQESSRILNDYNKYGEPMEKALEYFVRKSELTNGAMPGEFNESYNENNKFVCLTGNAQLAICILLMEKKNPDLRLVNAAIKLIDFIDSVQHSNKYINSKRAGVAGSYPLWGKYMFMRYPNWAAKYYCDSLLMTINRLTSEK